jgi:hypothetical protein
LSDHLESIELNIKNGYPVPVVYIVFNRPEITRKSWETIRSLQPRQLFVVADGPRNGNQQDAVKCGQVREIVKDLDWDCDSHFDFADRNLGLKGRISNGLDWVFQRVDKAVIIEDDCIGHPDFFSFCADLLEHYRHDRSVWVITGNNFQRGRWRGEGSYYFSRYNHCWGWATWAEAWRHYDRDLSFWPDWKGSEDWNRKITDPVERKYWEEIFDAVHAGRIDSWAYGWTAAAWYYGGLTATPNRNLVSNIGFGEDATHTKAWKASVSALPTYSLPRPLKHPHAVSVDEQADRFAFDNHFDGRQKRFPRKLLSLPRALAGRVYRKIFGARQR